MCSQYSRALLQANGFRYYGKQGKAKPMDPIALLYFYCSLAHAENVVIQLVLGYLV